MITFNNDDIKCYSSLTIALKMTSNAVMITLNAVA